MDKILRPTWAEIDIGAFRHNFKRIKKKLNKNTHILSVVKADAYGHGVVELGRASVEQGAKLLGVALIEEGILLRSKGVKAPILVMGSIYPLKNFSYVLKHDLIPAISSVMAAKELSRLAEQRNKKVSVFIKIDTGMGRIGISHENTGELIRKIREFPGLKVDGMFTHLASAAGDRKFTTKQIKRFRNIEKTLEESGIHVGYKSVSNSTAVLKYPEAHFNLARPGITLYGLLPYKNADKDIDLMPVMSLKTRIVYLKKVAVGATVSYRRLWRAKKDSFIATLPVGYADGYSRMLSNRGEVLIRGKRVPVVGNICMDMCMVDVTSLDGVEIGDKAVLIGSQGKERITAEEIADKTGTINYEITCCVGKRVPRVYV